MDRPRTQDRRLVTRYGRACGMVGGAALAGALLLAGCNAILDIGDIEFGDGGSGGSGLAGGGSPGGGGPGGGDGGQGGTPSSCTDGIQNGLEEGVDCGGPSCAECAEDCTNGADDDGNSLVDCEDPLCAGYGCATPPEAPWIGPIIVYLGDAPPASCLAGWPTGRAGVGGAFNAPLASCSPCGCDAPTGEICGVGSTEFYNSSGCNGGAQATVTPLAADTCTTGVSTSWLGSIGLAVQPTGGSCAPNGGAPNGDAPAWERSALSCEGAAQGGGCEAPGDVCVRSPVAPYLASFCIYQAGDLDCPGSPYTDKTVLYEGADDTRSCTGCECGAPSGSTCAGTTTLFSDGTCGTSVGSVSHPSSCVAHEAAQSLSYTVTAGPSGGTCAVSSQAVATGGVTQIGAYTVCCAPAS